MKQVALFIVLQLSTRMVLFTFSAATLTTPVLEESANWTRQGLFGARWVTWTRLDMLTMSFLMAHTFWSLVAMEQKRRRSALWLIVKWRVSINTRNWKIIMPGLNCIWCPLTSVKNFNEPIKYKFYTVGLFVSPSLFCCSCTNICTVRTAFAESPV